MGISKNIYYCIMLISLLLLIIRWRKLDHAVKLLFWVIAAAFVTEKISDLSYPALLSIYIHHIYQVIESVILSLYYFQLFKEKRNRLIVKIGFLFFCIYYFATFILNKDNFYSSETSDLVVNCVLITVYSVLYLIELYRGYQPVVLKTLPHFWIVIGNLMFYSVTIVYYVFQLYLIKNSTFYQQLSLIPQIANLLVYTFYSIAFVCQISMRKSA